MAQSNPPLDSQHTKGRFANKVCIITGGASGIGRATVNRFVNDGASVAAFDINEPAGEHLQVELTAAGYDVKFYKVDVADKEQCVEVVKKVAEEHEGKIHFLVNNAGVAPTRSGKFATDSNPAESTDVKLHFYSTEHLFDFKLAHFPQCHREYHLVLLV